MSRLETKGPGIWNGRGTTEWCSAPDRRWRRAAEVRERTRERRAARRRAIGGGPHGTGARPRSQWPSCAGPRRPARESRTSTSPSRLSRPLRRRHCVQFVLSFWSSIGNRTLIHMAEQCTINFRQIYSIPASNMLQKVGVRHATKTRVHNWILMILMISKWSAIGRERKYFFNI